MGDMTAKRPCYCSSFFVVKFSTNVQFGSILSNIIRCMHEKKIAISHILSVSI